MDIGEEHEPYVIEPIEDPVPRREREPEGPERESPGLPEFVPEREPLVPA